MIATRLDVLNQAEIQKDGLTALRDALGVTATMNNMTKVVPVIKQQKNIWMKI